MAIVTVARFAEKAGVDRQTIYNRIRSGEIKVIVQDIPSLRIDTVKFPPEKYGCRKRGPKSD